MASLLTPVAKLRGIGPVTAKKFHQLGIETLQDALWHFPFRHEDWRHVAPISQIAAGESATIRVTIEEIVARRAWRGRMNIVEARVTDDQGDSLRVVWFNMPYLTKTLKADDRIFLSGVVQTYRETIQMQNPAFEPVSADPSHQRLIPVYRSTTGLSQRQLRLVIGQALELADVLPDPWPSELRQEFHVLPLGQALRDIHQPSNPEHAAAALRRLKLDELLSWHLRTLMMHRAGIEHPAPVVRFHESAIRNFVQHLPFELTTDQRVAAWQTLQDMEQSRPMFRLIQGDVGSGKTVVAAIVARNNQLNGLQSVVIAPTVILAEQHFAVFSELFRGLDVTIALWTGSRIVLNTAVSTLSRPELLRATQSGQIDLLIGTHAVLDETLRFRSLGLVVVDEQQRFGVAQRQFLLDRHREDRGLTPHFLSLTATPIPRTLALFLMGALSMSVIREKPKGRPVVTTQVMGPDQRATIDQRIAEAIGRREQVFVVTPLIEESDMLGVRTATQEYQRLKEHFVHDHVAMIHGGMPAADRLAIMESFRRHEFDILVSTTVIEVGIDIPNATLMVIEGAERFGLSQLHQLRGRVGRGDRAATCLLVTDRSDLATQERLERVVRANDGFAIAELDLQERGSGEVYGIRQSGLPAWQLASLEDSDLIEEAQIIAGRLQTEYPAQFRDWLEAPTNRFQPWHHE